MWGANEVTNEVRPSLRSNQGESPIVSLGWFGNLNPEVEVLMVVNDLNP